MKKEKTKRQLFAEELIKEYQPKTLEDLQAAMKDIFGPLFETMLQGELEHHLGYESNDHGDKETENRRNGYNNKTLHTSYGDVDIKAPRDRKGSFTPVIIPKRKKDVTGIEDKVLAMYARGMSQRDIAQTIEEIYGFQISSEQISIITDRVLDELHEWQNRPLKRIYPFVFVDCLYVSLRQEYRTQECAVYVILGYDLEGHKEILGLWIGETESKHFWMQIFDEIKNRGVQEIFFISMDGVSGLEEGAKEIFQEAEVQRCIVHLIRNSLKYIPSKDYKEYTSDLKKVYSAFSLQAAKDNFIKFKERWSKYPGAVNIWERNFIYIEQLFDYTSNIRRIMYTTNAIESVNSSFRKVTKKGSFPNADAVYKALFLRIKELDRKWNNHPVQNWALVLNELKCIDRFSDILSLELNEL